MVSISRLRKGDKFKMQDGSIAHYIGKDKRLKNPLIFEVGGHIITRQLNGKHCETCGGAVFPAVLLDQPVKEIKTPGGEPKWKEA